MRRAAVFLAGVLLCACRGEAPVPQGRAASSGSSVLYRRLFGEPATLNAVLQTDVPEQLVLQYISRNLVDLDSKLAIRPGLAEKLEISPDGRTCTVHLRPDAVWEDGNPITPADGVFTLRRIVDAPSPLYKPFFEDLEALEVAGPHAFRARFRSPYAYRAMAFVLPLLPEHRFSGVAFDKAPANRAPLANGPYRLASWKAQESIALERNPRYWGEPGHFDRILFRILPDNSVAYRALVRGDLDESILDAGLKERASGDAEFASCCRLLEFFDLDFNYVALNTRLPFFQDARVRRALTMLLDRQAIVKNLYRGSARVISGPWPPESPAYDASVLPLPYDPAEAARLLDEAGWRVSGADRIRRKAGRRFEFELLVSAGSAIGRQIDETFAAELASAGIQARVRPIEWASLVERLDSGSFEAASLASSGEDPNPDPYSYWHSSQWPPRGLNSGYYRNPEADRLMDEARAEMDEARRMAIYHRLHRILRDDAPAIFLFNSTKKYGLRRRLTGVETSPLGLFSIWPGPIGWSATAAPAGTR